MAGIFKAYDVRGTFPEQINEDAAYKIGRAVAEQFKPNKVLIARDMRLSSPVISIALIKGFVDSGVNVIDAGLSTTPLFYCIMGKHDYDFGIMTTASHNPPAYNGMKFMKRGNISINHETGLNKVEELFKKNKFSKEKEGSIVKKDFRHEYSEYVLSFAKNIPKKNIVVDAGNGMAGYIYSEIFKKLGVNAVKLNFELDGRFPNHESNPLLPGVTDQLKHAVVKNKADFGVIFDGDADRIFFVDEKGRDVLGSIIGAMIAESFVKEKLEAIVHDATSSRIIRDKVGKKGKVIRAKTGYSYISKALIENNAIFGAEVSGHYSYRDNFFCDSGIISLLKVLEIVGNRKFSDVLKDYERYYNSGELNFEVEDKEKVMKKIASHFKDAEINYLDGVTVEYPDFWFIVRPSNTEPLLRFRLEADSEALMKEKVEEIKKLINNSS